MSDIRRQSSIAARVQALTLHGLGVKTPEIFRVTGIKRESFKALLRRAKDRGYTPGGPIKDGHVADGHRSGRPKVANKRLASRGFRV
ncbi:uncharacterized protein C8A04DRAFT_15842 [Dichotomopilus funicola]|uniref:Uncharacterized protein n=1 Tax=Dichotomopilus funicola TaxID=1934379 RepID=A0AAN6UUI4_9PEZI|nr:hypothetical protein C8A04DRAFT_15842 [Dichotomopilus funicola]